MDDQHNNWFPHVSLDGGAPKVIAYVYGGQGTINVPSWSPDGRMLAFVSNSDELMAAD